MILRAIKHASPIYSRDHCITNAYIILRENKETHMRKIQLINMYDKITVLFSNIHSM